MYTCMVCKESNLHNDEIVVYDCNGNINPSDEQSLERNAQNPDYAVVMICITCDDNEKVHRALAQMEKTGVFVPPPLYELEIMCAGSHYCACGEPLDEHELTTECFEQMSDPMDSLSIDELDPPRPTGYKRD